MKNIIVVTTPGSGKRCFVNDLFSSTNGAVKLVIVQTPRKKPFAARASNLASKVSLSSLPNEIAAYILCRYSRSCREVLGWMRGGKHVKEPVPEFPCPVVYVDDINNDEVRHRIAETKPYLMVVWGGEILSKDILELSEIAINIHRGYCPYYRGVCCYEQAILADDYDRIGVTIHYMDPKVDAGDIIDVVTGDPEQSPREFFREINEMSFQRYLEVATEIWRNGPLPAHKQDISQFNQYYLRDWNYGKSVLLARVLRERDKLYRDGG